MTDTTRCEPPPELRGVDGWHWVQPPVGEPHLARWHAADRPDVEPLWTSTQHVYSGTPRYAAREWGWRYRLPVATPVEVDALRAEVGRLREALAALYRGYVNTLEVGRDRIIDLGGACDPVDVMERGDPWLRAARAALAHKETGDEG